MLRQRKKFLVFNYPEAEYISAHVSKFHLDFMMQCLVFPPPLYPTHD